MHTNKAKHLPPKLASTLSKAKAKAKAKMAHASSSKQPDHSEVSDDSSSITEPSGELHKTSEVSTAEAKDDLEQMLKRDFAAFSAEEYQVEIGPLIEELRRWMNRQDALESLG